MTDSSRKSKVNNFNYTLVGLFFGVLLTLALENLLFFVLGLVIGFAADMVLKKKSNRA